MKKRSKKEQDSLESKQTPPRDNGSSISQDTQTTSSSQRSKTARKIKDSQSSTGGTAHQKTQESLKTPQPQPSEKAKLTEAEKIQQEKNDQAITMVRGYLVQTLALFVRATATVLRKYNVSEEFIKAIMDEATVELHRISEQDKKTSEGN